MLLQFGLDVAEVLFQIVETPVNAFERRLFLGAGKRFAFELRHAAVELLDAD